MKKCDFLVLRRILEDNGYKVTLQRKLILEELLKSKIHLSIHQICNKLRDKNIGLATIYRNINLFKSLNIVKKVVINDTNYYEIKIFSKDPLHIHFKCFKCGNIFDIKDKDVIYKYLKLNKLIEGKYDIEIFDINFNLTGICSECRKVKLDSH